MVNWRSKETESCENHFHSRRIAVQTLFEKNARSGRGILSRTIWKWSADLVHDRHSYGLANALHHPARTTPSEIQPKLAGLGGHLNL